MCCRYCFEAETAEYVRSLTGQAPGTVEWPSGDIRPSDAAPVIIGRGPDLQAEGMRWGFPAYRSKQLLINARAETAFEKASFAESMRERRCIIPAQQFYEWNKEKSMVTFTVPGRTVICMAGIYSRFADGYRFTVLTTAANASMLPTHDRMPVILGEDMLRDWVLDPKAAKEILKAEQPVLSAKQEYEQLSLF